MSERTKIYLEIRPNPLKPSHRIMEIFVPGKATPLQSLSYKYDDTVCGYNYTYGWICQWADKNGYQIDQSIKPQVSPDAQPSPNPVQKTKVYLLDKQDELDPNLFFIMAFQLNHSIPIKSVNYGQSAGGESYEEAYQRLYDWLKKTGHEIDQNLEPKKES